MGCTVTKGQYPRWMDGWMEKLSNEKQLSPLKDLVIAGSHNSGTFSLDKNMEIGPDEPNLIRKFEKFTKPVVYNWAVTQSKSIYQQLLLGIRYLDLRVAYRNVDEKIRVIHGLFGCTIEEVLDEVNRFLAKYPKEIVILHFQHFYDMNQAAHKKLADTLDASFSKILRAPGAQGPNVTLQEMWEYQEKVIVIYNETGVVDTHSHFWSPHFIHSPWPNTDDTKQLLEILKEQSEASSVSENTFQVTQAVLTPTIGTILGHVTSTLKDVLASECNRQVTEWLKTLRGTNSHKFNIIIADFVELNDFIPTVISLN